MAILLAILAVLSFSSSSLQASPRNIPVPYAASRAAGSSRLVPALAAPFLTLRWPAYEHLSFGSVPANVAPETRRRIFIEYTSSFSPEPLQAERLEGRSQSQRHLTSVSPALYGKASRSSARPRAP